MASRDTAMTANFLSVDQVAALLGLQAQTVRQYLRDGRLPGTKIGKQYRVARADLEAFTGRPLAPDPVPRVTRHVEVSSVVEIDAIDPDAANRITNTLMAATRSHPDVDVQARVDTVYNPGRGRLKIVLIGGMATTIGLLRLIETLGEPA